MGRWQQILEVSVLLLHHLIYPTGSLEKSGRLGVGRITQTSTEGGVPQPSKSALFLCYKLSPLRVPGLLRAADQPLLG